MSSAFKIPTVPGMGRSIVDHDPRNGHFPARGAVFPENVSLQEKTWRRVEAYDQGSTSMCVAYAGKGMVNTKPFSNRVRYEVRKKYPFEEWYRGAQRNDEWPEENYDGTSGNGLLKYLTAEGLIKEYRWCFGIDDVLKTVSYHGPVSVGTWWSSNMYHPNDKNFIDFTGQWVGGHQWQIIGVDPDSEFVTCMNSWGKNWGDKGRFYLRFDTLDQLLQEDGDAHTLVTI